MKKKIGLLLATVIVLNTAIASTAYGWTNPLKNYNLYEDDGISNLYKEGYYILTNIDYNYRKNNYE